MKSLPKTLLLAGAALVAAAFSSLPLAASADEAPSRTLWWLEGRPWTCSDAVGPVARQLELACDATGRRCGVAPERGQAGRVGAITCQGPDWVLEAEDGAGHKLWSVVLVGDEGTKIHKAALWMARDDGDAPLPPEPAPVPVAPAPTPETAKVIVVPAAAPPDADPEAEVSKDAAPKSKEDNHLLALDAQIFAGGVVDRIADGSQRVPMVGARAAVAFPITGKLFGGGALDGLTTPAEHPATYAHLGGLLALGAPYTKDWVGVSAEGGVSLAIGEDAGQGQAQVGAAPGPQGRAFVTPEQSGPSQNGPVPHGYGKASAILQWPREHGVRPYLAVSYVGSTDAMNRTVLASLGLACGAW